MLLAKDSCRRRASGEELLEKLLLEKGSWISKRCFTMITGEDLLDKRLLKKDMQKNKKNT